VLDLSNPQAAPGIIPKADITIGCTEFQIPCSLVYKLKQWNVRCNLHLHYDDRNPHYFMIFQVESNYVYIANTFSF
jgi:hypothetical protein